MRNNFPKRPSGAPPHTWSKLYDVPVGFVTPPPFGPLFDAVSCVNVVCGQRRMAAIGHRVFSLVLHTCTPLCIIHVNVVVKTL